MTDSVIRLADFVPLTRKRSRKPQRTSPSTAQVQVLAYVITAIVEAAQRGIVSRYAADFIFDHAETISLQGETPTEATGVIRDIYERIAPTLPEHDGV